VQNSLEIVPGIGLGPYRIGMPVAEVLLQISPRDSANSALVTSRCISYHDIGRCIHVNVDIRIGLCFQIVARAGFSGKTSQGIQLNMKSSEALRLDDSLYLDEFYGTLESKNFPGYYLELDDPDPLPGNFEHLSIVGIGVANASFSQELEIKDLANIEEANELRKRMFEYYLRAKDPTY